VAQENPNQLRALASWYREFAERAENPAIWDSRLRMAEDLDAEAMRLDTSQERPLSPRIGRDQEGIATRTVIAQATSAASTTTQEIATPSGQESAAGSDQAATVLLSN